MKFSFFLLTLLLSFAAQAQKDSLLRADIKTQIDSVEALYGNGKYAEALTLVNAQLAKAEYAFGKKDSLVGDCLYHLAVISYNNGSYSEGVTFGKESLNICASFKGYSPIKCSWRLNILSMIFGNMSQYEKALPLALEATDVILKTLGKEHEEYAYNLSNLADIYRDIGQYEKALLLSQEVIEITIKNHGKDDPNFSVYLNTLARIYLNMGHYEKALPLFLEALEIDQKKWGKGHPIISKRLNNLAELYLTIGLYEKALSLYTEVKINIENNLNESSFLSVILNNLALTYNKMGQFDKALPLNQASLAAIEKSLGKAHVNYGVCLNNLVLVYNELGQYEQAIKFAIEAKQSLENSLGRAHPSYGLCISNLALIYEKMGQHELALPIYLESKEIIEKNLGKDHSNNRILLTNLAGLYRKMGQNGMALSWYNQCLRNLFHEINQNFNFFGEREKLNFIKTIEKDFKQYRNFFVDYAIEKPELSAVLYDMELSLKGLILHSQVTLKKNISEQHDSSITAMYDELDLLKKLLIKQYNLPKDKQRKDLQELEDKADRLEGNLASKSNQFKQIKAAGNLKWQQVQQSLKTGEVAIEFITVSLKKDTIEVPTYVALLLKKNSTYPEIIRLCSEKEIEELLDKKQFNTLQYVEHIYGSSTQPNQGLYNLIWKPLEKALQGIETIHYAPTGLLHQVSFAAIQLDKNSYLSNKFDLRQVSSTGSIVFQDQLIINPDDKFLLVGGVNYSSDTTKHQLWKYLPGSLTEITSISKTLSKNKMAHQQLASKGAREETIKQQAEQVNILHIATHGFFFSDQKKAKEKLKNMAPEKTEQSLVFRGSSEYADILFVNSDNPLMRSGLVLAGANDVWERDWYKQGEDGILTAAEISNLNLTKSKLAILSACETGLGDVYGSEGVFGLQRAFKMAGAKSLIMSLWQVPDKETSEFMASFYKHLLKQKDIHKAFTITQNEMRKKYSPFFWAAFVLVE